MYRIASLSTVDLLSLWCSSNSRPFSPPLKIHAGTGGPKGADGEVAVAGIIFLSLLLLMVEAVVISLSFSLFLVDTVVISLLLASPVSTVRAVLVRLMLVVVGAFAVGALVVVAVVVVVVVVVVAVLLLLPTPPFETSTTQPSVSVSTSPLKLMPWSPLDDPSPALTGGATLLFAISAISFFNLCDKRRRSGKGKCVVLIMS